MPDTFPADPVAMDDLRTILTLIHLDGCLTTTTEVLADADAVYLYRPADDEGAAPSLLFEIPRSHLLLVGEALIELARAPVRVVT